MFHSANIHCPQLKHWAQELGWVFSGKDDHSWQWASFIAEIFPSFLLPTGAQDLCSHLQQTPGPVPGHQTDSEILPTWLCQLIHTSASHILHVWETLGTKTCACWSELQNVSANTALLLQRWIQNTLNQNVVSCSSGEQQSKRKQQNKWYIKSSGKISGLGENSCVLSCDSSLNNTKLCLSLAKKGENSHRTSQYMFRGRIRASDTTNCSFLGSRYWDGAEKFLLENFS